MEAIVPYLSFDGSGNEALEFYSKALNGKVLFKQSFGESAMGDKTPKEYKDRLMHATFQAGSLTFMASDGPPGFEIKRGNNVNLSLHFTSLAEVEKIFAALSEGGTITMPLQKTFWAERFGMLTDKYGVNWMFNHDDQKKEK
jgi:PhnB protein